ncbi:MAG: hypothetical protein ACR2H9_01705 [Longimicrobiaceae bacterium]
MHEAVEISASNPVEEGAIPDELTPKAREQLAASQRAVAPLGTPEAARAAGYRPMFGQLPTMGEHWVNMEIFERGGFDVERPSTLIFSPVEGKPTLVGVAYGFRIPTGAPMPEGFDGDADRWHAHPGLADLPGKQLVMVHAWFVPAPDGPFANHNPWLPYMAAGLQPPPASALADTRENRSARTLALALWQSTGELPFGGWIQRRGGAELRRQVEADRAAIRTLVPELRAAQAQQDAAEFARLAERAVAHWERIEAAYRSVGGPFVNQILDEALAEIIGESHGAAAGHAGHSH